uniref:SWIM-type domain-containing protein n=1 Tax=Chenopodium quinoa TaxID=63459 RepID=A0A803MP97_CHEQI
MSESVEHCSSSVTTEDSNVRIFKTPTQPLLSKIYYNFGGDKEYMPCCSSENKPFLGMIFDSLQDGIAFYYKYANECGFKVRSGTTKSQKNKDDPTGKGVTLIKYLLCSKEGYVTNNKKSGKQVEGACLKRKTVKRVCCPAKIKFRFCNDGKYMVYCFYESHSHPFSTPITRQHAADIYTRAIFYDFQEECQGPCFSCGVESCSSLYGDGVEFSVIVDHEKRKNFDVNFDLATYESSCTCRMFESQGVLCRHILFVMKVKCVREIPDAYILNRWRKDVLKKASVIDVALDDASKYDKKKQLVSILWSNIFSCVSLTDQSEDDLSELIKTLSLFEEQVISKNIPENAPSSKEVEDADIQVLVGSNEVDVNVLPPNQCINKGSARSSKRLKSAKEIATEEKSKKGRTCRACGQSGVSHDSRNSPNK